MKTLSTLTFALVMMFQAFAMGSVARTSSGSTPCPLKAGGSMVEKRNYSSLMNEQVATKTSRPAQQKARAADTRSGRG